MQSPDHTSLDWQFGDSTDWISQPVNPRELATEPLDREHCLNCDAYWQLRQVEAQLADEVIAMQYPDQIQLDSSAQQGKVHRRS